MLRRTRRWSAFALASVEELVEVTTFSPGFRMSAVDGSVLALGAIAAAASAAIDPSWGLAIGLPVVHFFFFCNVFRISRPLELLWTGVFLILAALTVVWGAPGWLATVVVSVFVACAVVVAEMCKPSYHGVVWQRINPRLREWWEQHGPRAQDAESVAGSDGG